MKYDQIVQTEYQKPVLERPKQVHLFDEFWPGSRILIAQLSSAKHDPIEKRDIIYNGILFDLPVFPNEFHQTQVFIRLRAYGYKSVEGFGCIIAGKLFLPGLHQEEDRI